MKVIGIKTLATGIVATVLLFTGCKKTEGPAGAAGAQGAAGVVPSYSDGFIQGTLLGTQRDGTPISETFTYTTYFNGYAGTLDSVGATSFNFSLTRTTSVFNTNIVKLNISTLSPTSTSSAGGSITFGMQKPIGTNKVLVFSNLGSAGSPTFTSLSYNRTTGIFTGSFNVNLTAVQTNTGKTATISGTFQTTITQLYYIKKHMSTILPD